MLENLKELTRLNDLIQADGEKFAVTGNKAAGTRVRKNLQLVKNLAHETRKEISASKNATEALKQQ